MNAGILAVVVVSGPVPPPDSDSGVPDDAPRLATPRELLDGESVGPLFASRILIR